MEDGDDDDNDDDDETTLMAARRMGRHRVLADFGKLGRCGGMSLSPASSAPHKSKVPESGDCARLPEIVLPIVMPFLRCERVHVGWCVGYGGIM
jgi:hypothetical protein